MTQNKTDQITGYHAHVYYDPDTEAVAADLRAALEKGFDVTMGRWRPEPVGPHPQSMYQVAFAPQHFAAVVPFLALNRGPLNVLVHPLTDDAYADHIDFAMWLGDRLTLNTSVLKRGDSA